MKLRIKKLGIRTGGILIAVMHKEDAKLMDLRGLDRIKIKKGKLFETVVVDVDEHGDIVKKGEIGVFHDIFDSINLKNREIVEIIPTRRPLSIAFIRKKLDGCKLNQKELAQIVWDIVHNKLDDIELTYFVSSCYTRSMDMDEIVWLTKEMTSHGDILTFNKKPIVDLHCIGGVAGNRTTPIVVPIIAAAGYTIPKTASRSITSPAGTADTMETITNVAISAKEMKKVVEKVGACIVWGGALNLAPADDKIIKVEKPLMIDAESQLLASIMAKKLSVSATHLLIDIPTGNGAKLTRINEAVKLKEEFEELAKRVHIKIRVMITDGEEPIGNGIGPALEMRDILWVLKNDKRGPADLKEKSLSMAAEIFDMLGKKEGKQLAKKILESGKAYEKFMEIVEAQGRRHELKIGSFEHHIVAGKTGKLVHIDNRAISKITRIAGSPECKGAGIYLCKHVGSNVKKGEKIATLYAENETKLKYAVEVHNSLDGFVVQ